MAHQQHAADFYPDELCPPNKRYDLMDANKKVDFEQVQSMANVVQDIFQMLDNTCNWMGSTTVADNANDPTESYPGTHKTPTPLGHLTLKWIQESQVLQNDQFLAEHKSREEQEAGENVELVNEHLAYEDIEKMMDGSENVIEDTLPPRNDELNIPGTRLEPRSDKESLEVEITNDEEVEITNVVIPVNVNDEEEEITDEVCKLKRREKGKIVEESSSTPFPTPIRSPRIHTDLVSLDTKKLQELTETVTKITPSSRSSSTKFLSRKSFDTLTDHLQEVMVESLPTMVDTHIKEKVKKQVPEQVRDQVPVYVAKGLILERQQNKEETDKMIAKAMLHERKKL
ncbi:hypothetical protein Tco_0867324 [Tanacetum coccineum]